MTAITAAENAHKRNGQLSGVATGLASLDELLGGLHRSDLVILAGRPGMGKTALATNIAFAAARAHRTEDDGKGGRRTVDGAAVGFFSIEMSAEQLVTRILAEQAGVPSERMRRGQLTSPQLDRVISTSAALEGLPLYIDPAPSLTIGALRARARRLQRQRGLGLIVVDYLQLVDASNRKDGRVQEVSEITRGLKTLAKELDVPVLALSQLSRAVESRTDKRPQLSDLRDSGTIEQDADVVMFVYREEYYLERGFDADRARVAEVAGQAELLIAKAAPWSHRRGAPALRRRHYQVLRFLGQRRGGSSMIVQAVPATMEHARAINLRAADLREVEALGMTKDQALQGVLARSLWADAYLVDGEVAALLGVMMSAMIGGEATAWLMTGRPVDRHRKDFLRITRARVSEMLAKYGTLTCHVHAEYAGAIRWLRWLGFSLGPVHAGFRTGTLRKGLHIGPCTVEDIEGAPNLRTISEEFAAESLAPGIPRSAPRWGTYRALESSGMLHPIAARLDGLLIGFIGVLFAPMSRYSGPIATTERFFVLKAHRKTGAGLKLLRAAEEKARALGSPGLLVTAPFEGDLFHVLPRTGYRESNRVFFKPLPVAA